MTSACWRSRPKPRWQLRSNCEIVQQESSKPVRLRYQKLWDILYLSYQGMVRPIQEAGYKSYMIEGRGKDLFFCEVYSGGRYKIKAELNGNYPFKYIAEGNF